MSKQIVTITSDFGLRDPYAAMLKGHVLQIDADLVLVDISHEVNPFNVLEGSLLLRGSYPAFSTGTIHLFCVNQSFDPTPYLAIYLHRGHYFLGPDNGFFSLLFPDESLEDGRQLKVDVHQSWHEVYAFAIQQILENDDLTTVGEPKAHLREAIALRPVVSADFIRASITHIDRYGNILLNIDQKTFNEVRRDRPFEVYYQRKHPIRALVDRYQDAGVGEILARFNSSGFLEIGIYLDNAAALLSLEVDQLIQIDFKNEED